MIELDDFFSVRIAPNRWGSTVQKLEFHSKHMKNLRSYLSLRPQVKRLSFQERKLGLTNGILRKDDYEKEIKTVAGI